MGQNVGLTSCWFTFGAGTIKQGCPSAHSEGCGFNVWKGSSHGLDLGLGLGGQGHASCYTPTTSSSINGSNICQVLLAMTSLSPCCLHLPQSVLTSRSTSVHDLQPVSGSASLPWPAIFWPTCHECGSTDRRRLTETRTDSVLRRESLPAVVREDAAQKWTKLACRFQICFYPCLRSPPTRTVAPLSVYRPRR